MPTIIAESEKVKQALKWIAGERMDDETKKLDLLIQIAATKFNLSPKDEDFICVFYQDKG